MLLASASEPTTWSASRSSSSNIQHNTDSIIQKPRQRCRQTNKMQRTTRATNREPVPHGARSRRSAKKPVIWRPGAKLHRLLKLLLKLLMLIHRLRLRESNLQLGAEPEKTSRAINSKRLRVLILPLSTYLFAKPEGGTI